MRRDGRVATRNHIGVLTSVNGWATAARAIADHFRRDLPPNGERSAIAEEARVNVDTVYATVGTKPKLSGLPIETALSGVDVAVPAHQREYLQRIRAEPDARAKLAHCAAAVAGFR